MIRVLPHLNGVWSRYESWYCSWKRKRSRKWLAMKKSETNAFPWQKKVQSKLLGVPFPFYVHFIVRNFRLINASLRGHGFTAVLQFRAIKKFSSWINNSESFFFLGATWAFKISFTIIKMQLACHSSISNEIFNKHGILILPYEWRTLRKQYKC